MALEEKLKQVPTSPGVYIFKGKRGNVLYVGKAASLRDRVRSYFGQYDGSLKVSLIRQNIADLEWIVTDSETEALILELNLIKKYKPPYNIRMRDDKHYPFVKITLNEPFPRIVIVRRIRQDGARYFGPYADSKSLKEVLRLLRKNFQIRQCNLPLTGEENIRPCLFYHIGQCLAPCSGAVSRERYMEAVNEVITFLEGHSEELREKLWNRMMEEAEKLNFEQAAKLRDRIRALDRVIDKQKVVFTEPVDEDVISFAQAEDVIGAQVFMVRAGRLIGGRHFLLQGAEGESREEITSSFIQQYYQGELPPPLIIVEDVPEDAQLISRWLSERKHRDVVIRKAENEEEKELVEMARRNATIALRAKLEEGEMKRRRAMESLEALRLALNLDRIPRRIEGYDISHLGGNQAVGSMVVFEDGEPQKSKYRKFNIKYTEKLPDDYAMMKETLRRRILRGKKGDEKFLPFPDLIVIDGGKGHLSSALEVLFEENILPPTIGLAKRLEEIYLPDSPQPLRLPEDSKALHLLQRIRNEAHRFAITQHRGRREKAAFMSALEQVEGIGKKRRKMLLDVFGSLEELKKASPDKIARLAGVPLKVAERLLEVLNKEEEKEEEES